MINPNLISVIIPVYNGAKFIESALNSVLKQDYQNFEIIVVNDGSIDNSETVIKTYNVTYIKQDNMGVAAARNNGIDNAKGKFIAFLDQDDIWVSNKLRLQIDTLKTNQELGYVLSHQILHLDNGVNKPNWLKENQLEQPIIGYLPSTLMVRKEILNKIGLFDNNYKLGSDTEWFFRANEQKIKMKIMSEVLVHRLIHGSNHSHTVGNSHIELLKINVMRLSALFIYIFTYQWVI